MTELLQTPLAGLHQTLGAKMVPFAGYAMPVQYPMGVLKEHLHCRAKAGLFDVSHMGPIMLRPRSGRIEDAAAALETLVPVSILGLKPHRQRYALFTNDQGGVLDDLMVAHRGDHLLLVVNAACKQADEAHLRAHLSDVCEITPLTDHALLALQGPSSEAALATLVPESASMRFMDVRACAFMGSEVVVTRSGYTGEDGFEILIQADRAVALAEALLAHADVEPIGLGARDSLRLESGLCLYGQDMTTETTPVEASLGWAIQKVRRTGGERAGGFPGAGRILQELDAGAARCRIGLIPEGRAPLRQGVKLYADETSEAPIGEITSGGYGPSLEKPVAMAMIGSAYRQARTLSAELRGRRVPVRLSAMPFITQTYKR